jgi:hypothetical protein
VRETVGMQNAQECGATRVFAHCADAPSAGAATV